MILIWIYKGKHYVRHFYLFLALIYGFFGIENVA